MARKPPRRDPIGAYQRKVTAARRVGVDAQCACGEKRPEALIPRNNPTICAECRRKKHGHKTLDDHHVAGEANSPVTIPLPVNDHRARLSVDQYDWPKKTLENPDGSPLLTRAARIRGYADTVLYLNEKLLLPDADMDELLDAFLTEKFGPQWWHNTELERFKPER
jgi:hypothetical protein